VIKFIKEVLSETVDLLGEWLSIPLLILFFVVIFVLVPWLVSTFLDGWGFLVYLTVLIYIFSREDKCSIEVDKNGYWVDYKCMEENDSSWLILFVFISFLVFLIVWL